MNKFAALAVAFAASTLMAAPASAADLRVSSPANPSVRISVAGKSSAQMTAEIKAAAISVCSNGQGLDNTCLSDAIQDANSQLGALTAAHRIAASTNVRVSREGPTSVRVSLKGKTPSQVDTDITAAAHAVCKESSIGNSDYLSCVTAAVDDAKVQLRSVAQLDRPRQFVSN